MASRTSPLKKIFFQLAQHIPSLINPFVGRLGLLLGWVRKLFLSCKAGVVQIT